MKKLLLITLATILFLFSVSSCTVLRDRPISLYKKVKNTKISLHRCGLPVIYLINKDVPENVKTIIIRSFKYWDDLTEKNLFFYMGITNWSSDDIRSGIIVVVDIKELKTVEHEANGALAYTNLIWYTISGCLSNGGITIYKSSLELSDDRLESIIKHEVGHILGLGHSPHSRDLMHEVIRVFDRKKDLTEWELKAFKIYYDNKSAE